MKESINHVFSNITFTGTTFRGGMGPKRYSPLCWATPFFMNNQSKFLEHWRSNTAENYNSGCGSRLFSNLFKRISFRDVSESSGNWIHATR